MSAFLDMIRLFYHRRFYTSKQIESYQLKQINRLLNSATKNCEYYRNTLVDTSLASLDAMARLPMINKETLMMYFSEMNSYHFQKEDVMSFALQKEETRDFLGYYQDKVVVGLSSGTSGNKGVFLTDKTMTQKLPFVFLARSGIPLRLLPYRISFFLRVFSQGFQDINSPIIKLQYIHTMTETPLIVEKIMAQRSNLIMAPPSLLRTLMPFADAFKSKIRLIVSYAEVLEKEQKHQFEKVFGAKVVEIYQASEGQIASACSLGNLHINEDLVYVEVVDDTGNQVEQELKIGHMIVTNLVNHVQPLIRYQMNDMIRIGKPCPCGSRFRVIDTIVGRKDDVFYVLNDQGQVIPLYPDLLSRWIITASEDLIEFKATQQENRAVVLEIECQTKDQFEEVSKKILDSVSKNSKVYHIDIELSIVYMKPDMHRLANKHQRFFVKKGV